MCTVGDTCAICLTSIRRTRHTPELKCGHIFHGGCIEQWEDQGGETCPLCRKMLNGAKYRVTLSIENLETRTSNTYNIPGDVAQSVSERLRLQDDMHIFNTDILFDVENLEELAEMLRDFGIPDADTLILNTE
jgi:hypothetical protein